MVAQISTVAYGDKSDKIKTILFTWTSATDQSVSQTFLWDGALVRMATNPGATAPTDNYDITLVDADGIDLLAGEGANRDTSTSEQVFPTNTPFHNGTVTFTIATAGAEKTGTCTLYMAWG